MEKRTLILVVSWTIAFIAALCLDSAVATFMHDTGIARLVQGKWWAQIIKAPGDFRFTMGVAAVLLLCKQINWKQALFLLLAGVISGVNSLVKWIVGRTRPFKLAGLIQPRPFELHPFRYGLRGLFTESNLSFPSGHACIAFALLSAIVVVWPRGAWFFVILAVAVGIERIAENAHYFSDVVGAAGLGMLGVSLLSAALSGWMKPLQPTGFPLILTAPPEAPTE